MLGVTPGGEGGPARLKRDRLLLAMVILMLAILSPVQEFLVDTICALPFGHCLRILGASRACQLVAQCVVLLMLSRYSSFYLRHRTIVQTCLFAVNWVFHWVANTYILTLGGPSEQSALVCMVGLSITGALIMHVQLPLDHNNIVPDCLACMLAVSCQVACGAAVVTISGTLMLATISLPMLLVALTIRALLGSSERHWMLMREAEAGRLRASAARAINHTSKRVMVRRPRSS